MATYREFLETFRVLEHLDVTGYFFAAGEVHSLQAGAVGENPDVT
eukprot:CAMPEP_0171739078 /NCGR_PEP_ID=MMETSP0991-20121206/34013_1 /TAXON_ID=483369 /ORGANISM="non described non described, Strain CCMP2098" /LENGTH=44 /DNA_ID= /DNA_START= /DNA_END= /DNA_ORIENTATION=